MSQPRATAKLQLGRAVAPRAAGRRCGRSTGRCARRASAATCVQDAVRATRRPRRRSTAGRCRRPARSGSRWRSGAWRCCRPGRRGRRRTARRASPGRCSVLRRWQTVSMLTPKWSREQPDVVAGRLGRGQERPVRQEHGAGEVVGQADPGEGARLVARKPGDVGQPVEPRVVLQQAPLDGHLEGAPALVEAAGQVQRRVVAVEAAPVAQVVGRRPRTPWRSARARAPRRIPRPAARVSAAARPPRRARRSGCGCRRRSRGPRRRACTGSDAPSGQRALPSPMRHLLHPAPRVGGAPVQRHDRAGHRREAWRRARGSRGGRCRRRRRWPGR